MWERKLLIATAVENLLTESKLLDYVDLPKRPHVGNLLIATSVENELNEGKLLDSADLVKRPLVGKKPINCNFC